MKITLNNDADPNAFAKRLFYLAWKACGSPLGMGVFRNRPQATEDEVFQNVLSAGDYACNMRSSETGLYGDYVFGRMMKFGFEVNNGVFEFRDDDFRPDYQGFARTYPNSAALVDATAKSLGVTVELVG
jgi:hypothetical protein